MCGRYYVDERTWDAVQRDILEPGTRFERPAPGDVAPSMRAFSVTAGADGMPRPALLSWGFPGYDGKRLVINARAESIAEKSMFADSIRERRCVLPAAGFYEWDREKQKVTFTLPGSPAVYLAGIWRPYGPDSRFVIITREANGSMLPFHDRMPLMIGPGDVRSWLFDPDRTEELLGRPLPELAGSRDYEQMSLF